MVMSVVYGKEEILIGEAEVEKTDESILPLLQDTPTKESKEEKIGTVTSSERRWGRLHNQKQNSSNEDAIPFVSHHPISEIKLDNLLHDLAEHTPPEGFAMSARVVSSSDGLSYFSDDVPDFRIPFLECGTVGRTTQPIQLRHLAFRHLPPQKASPAWSNTGPIPQIVVCLHPLQITVSGAPTEPREFEAGDVILMEDSMGQGHKISALNNEEKDLSVLILTLNQRHQAKLSSKSKPCSSPYSVLSKPSHTQKYLNFRRLFLTSAGLGVSSLLTFFLGKVAPHVLAVGVGGACVIVGGTCGVVYAGENFMNEYDNWRHGRVLLANEKDL